MTPQKVNALVDKYVAAIMEHLPLTSIQILASMPYKDGTLGISRGGGDWYARQALAANFVEEAKADFAAQKVAEEMAKSQGD